MANNLPELMMSSGDDEIWVNAFNEDSARKFREQLRAAAKSDPKKPIIVHIDSYGGQVDSLSMMIESMDEISNPIITVCQGKAMSCGAVLLSHGDIRFCGKNARVMVHEVSSGSAGDVHDVYADAIEAKRLNRWFMGLLAKNCGIKGGYDALRKMIKDQDGRDRYMDADQAIKFGIVDAVGIPVIEETAMYGISIVPPKKRLREANVAAKKNKTKTKNKKTDSKQH